MNSDKPSLPAHGIPRVILVTGAARRVGAEIVRILHAAGADVAIHYHTSTSEALALKASLNALRPESAAAFAADLRDMGALPGLVTAVVDYFGRLDGLVNNASSFYPTKVGATDTAAWDDLIGTNLKAPLFLAQAAAPQLVLHGGCIVNLTDVHAERPLKGYALYCAAKAGLLGLTRALAIELGPQVRVNAVAPGAVDWPENASDFPSDERQAIIEHTLLKRVGSATDIARAVRFLVFDAPYMTGQVITVDGGRSAHL
ncbi:pteridine reductase [Rugosibacter aromaticivorans]|uniref:pteridine reductase n=1 Tax=Rugosibacter aromaticivorans TaxID=1565605 RepID=UPI000B02D606|nr:pteridine reductase [Rugosibacter aromaticivorans]